MRHDFAPEDHSEFEFLFEKKLTRRPNFKFLNTRNWCLTFCILGFLFRPPLVTVSERLRTRMYLASCGQQSRQVDMGDSRGLKTVSGYDLLDKLSRRRMYARSNVREKSSLSDHFDQQHVIISLDDVDIEVEGLG